MNLGCVEIIDNVVCGFRWYENPDSEENLIKIDFDNLMIPDGVTEIRDNAFDTCVFLKNITIPNSVVRIGKEAFKNCYELKNVILSNNLTAIKDRTFYRCIELQDIKIPNSVCSIGKEVFYGCDDLKEITIPQNVKSVSALSFVGCKNLQKINVDKNNKLYCSEKHSLFNKDKSKLICCPQGKRGNMFELPETVVEIGDFAFMNCENLIKISFSDKVTEIGASAFNNCKNLVSCGSLKNIERIGSGIFFGCDKLISPKANYKSFFLRKDKMYETYKPVAGERLFEENKWTEEVSSGDIQESGYYYYTNLFEVFYRCFGEINENFVIYECEVGDFTIGLDFVDFSEAISSKRMTTKIKPINKLTKEDIINKLHSTNVDTMYDEMAVKLTIC